MNTYAKTGGGVTKEHLPKQKAVRKDRLLGMNKFATRITNSG